MRVPLHLQRRFATQMYGKAHLRLYGIKSAGPVDGIPYTHVSALSDASYPCTLFIGVDELLIDPLFF